MKYRVIVETDFRNRPKEHELSAAILIANYFETDITFLRPSCQHTPDLNIKGVKWELIRHLMVITKSEVILEII